MSEDGSTVVRPEISIVMRADAAVPLETIGSSVHSYTLGCKGKYLKCRKCRFSEARSSSLARCASRSDTISSLKKVSGVVAWVFPRDWAPRTAGTTPRFRRTAGIFRYSPPDPILRSRNLQDRG